MVGSTHLINPKHSANTASCRLTARGTDVGFFDWREDLRSLQYRVQEIGNQDRIIATAHFNLEQPQAIMENSDWLVNLLGVAAESYNKQLD